MKPDDNYGGTAEPEMSSFCPAEPENCPGRERSTHMGALSLCCKFGNSTTIGGNEIASLFGCMIAGTFDHKNGREILRTPRYG